MLRLLMADRRGWIARTLVSVLAPAEWTMVRVHSAAEVHEQAPRIRPHVVLLHDDLEDVEVPTLCAELRRRADVGTLTPIIVVSTQPLRERRLASLRAGATAYSVFPPDSEPFLLELRALAVARREAEYLERAALVDARSGLYTVAGLRHRAREIANDASRRHDAVTCVALTAGMAPIARTPDDTDLESPAPAGRPRDVAVRLDATLDDAMARARRASDAVGRLEDVLVAIAPATGGVGAQRMTERLREVLERAGETPSAAAAETGVVRASFCTVADLARSSLDLEKMVDRAITLLMTTQPSISGPSPIVGEEIPLRDPA